MADYIRQDYIKRRLQDINCRIHNLLKETAETNTLRCQWNAILRLDEDITEVKEQYRKEFIG